MPSFRRSLSNAHEVQQALALLHAHPYGCDDPLGAPSEGDQEKACHVIVVAVLPRLMHVCECHGLTKDEANDVIYPRINEFLTRAVALVPPVIERAFGWMDRACTHGAKYFKRRRFTRLEILERAYVEGRIGEVAGGGEEPGCSPDSVEMFADEAEDEPCWLDASMPRGITHKMWMHAIDQLSPANRSFLDLMFQCLAIDRSQSLAPREFDRESYRLKATEMAERLGRTSNSVSVQWAKIQKQLRRTVSRLRAAELRAEGRSVPMIRASIEQLGLSAREVDKVLSQVRLRPEQVRGGAQ